MTDVKPGDRVAYVNAGVGAYSEKRNVPADKLVPVPDSVSDEAAATLIFKALTAQYLLRKTHRVEPGDLIVVHAAAGGVGLIACQWAKRLGVNVIGTVGSEEKAELAKAHGCAHVINYKTENFVERVKEITDGKGVPVVYDSVGKTTFMDSLDCLQRRGTMVSFGNASGPVDPFSPGILSAKGSLYLTRPSMNDYAADVQEYQASARALFDVIKSGVKIPINQKYALKNIAQAHKDLEGRKTKGSSILIS